jgi:hypothetical protein
VFYSAVAEIDDRVVGSNFLDERNVIGGVGPITVDPTLQNRAVGGARRANHWLRDGHRFLWSCRGRDERRLKGAYRRGQGIYRPWVFASDAQRRVIPLVPNESAARDSTDDIDEQRALQRTRRRIPALNFVLTSSKQQSDVTGQSWDIHGRDAALRRPRTSQRDVPILTI